MSKNTVKLLEIARETLSKEGAWTKRSYARDQHGRPVPYNSRSAVRFCSIGALFHSYDAIRKAEPSYGEGNSDIMGIALTALEAAMDPKEREELGLPAVPISAGTGSYSVMTFNDHQETVAPVLRMFDTAIATEAHNV